VNLIKVMLKDSNGKVKIQGQLIEVFGIDRGLRQGDTQSITLLNIVLEKLIRNIETNQNGTLFKKTRQCIAYDDDVFILGKWVRAIGD
jgi:Reverse transcriptase (RNA-dependent DNA polymerase).